MKFAARKLSLQVIFFGNALWQGMYGHFEEEKYKNCSNDAQDFFALFRMQADRLTKMELDRWATISWAIWNARNKFYFEKIQQHPKAIMEGAIGYLDEYQKLAAAMRNP